MKKFVWLGVFVGLGCGGAEPSTGEPDRSSGSEQRVGLGEEPGEQDGMQIEGLDGTIDPSAVAAGVDSVVPTIMECFAARYDTIEMLSGEFALGFRIARDGSVITARLLHSTVGDRETERCIVRAARSIRFSAPHGGEAEASHSLELDLPEDVRPPVSWPVEKAQGLVSQNGGPSLKMRCGAETTEVVITAYVARGGRALAVGAAGDVEARALDCLADAVRDWKFADPGSYPAKVSITF